MLEHVPLRLEGGWTQNPGTESLAASEHSLSHRTARTQKHTKTHTVKYQKCALSTAVVPLLQCWSKVKICLQWTQVSRVLLVVNRLVSLRWRHNERDGVSNHQPHGCLLKRLFRRRSKRTSKLLVTGLCEGNSPVAGEFPTQRASNAENVSIWWRHHVGKHASWSCLPCICSFEGDMEIGWFLFSQQLTYPCLYCVVSYIQMSCSYLNRR